MRSHDYILGSFYYNGGLNVLIFLQIKEIPSLYPQYEHQKYFQMANARSVGF